MTDNTKTWLLIADASHGRIYSIHKAKLLREGHAKELTLIGEFDHENSRKKGMELASDRQGGFGNGTFVEATSPKSHEAEQFAMQLLAQLETGRNENHYRDLIIVAPAAFMGLLHKHMANPLHKLISQTIEKDYTHCNERELVENLLTHF